MRRRVSLPGIALFLAVASTLHGANEKRHEPVGRMIGGTAVIEWQPAIDHERLVLTVVSPDSEVFSKEFPAGKNPTYRLQDHPGPKGAVDGEYSYEIRVVPRISGSVRQRLNEARRNGDDAAIARIRREAGLDQTIVQSGSFSVLNGKFLDPGATESTSHDSSALTPAGDSGASTQAASPARLRPAVNDQVIPDDLIVQGSTCTGFDCVNNESFGFDTFRLKENNLRIHFDDTSSTAGYPANDWRLSANDSASGGASKFTIEDATAGRVPLTVEAGSPANALYVDSTGNIGISQSQPGLDLHMTTSDTPAVRMEQTNSGGFTAQTWDIGANEANFFVRDLTGGSRLSFRIRPGAPTSSIDIGANGNVGFGTASSQNASTRAHFFSQPDASVAMTFGYADTGPGVNFGYAGGSYGRSSFFMNMRPDASAVAPNPSLRFLTSDVLRLIIDNEGYLGIGVTNPSHPIHLASGAHVTVGGVWTNASSRELKNDIHTLDLDEAKKTITDLNPVVYRYKADPAEQHVGFIAEDVPQIVATGDRQGLSPMDIVAVLTTVVKDQQKTIDELTKRIEQLEKKE